MNLSNSVMEEMEDQVTCWVCFEIFSNPITLPCSHSFCQDCALKVQKKNANCPFCRRPFVLPLPPVNKEIETLVAQFLKAKEPVVDEAVVPQNAPIFWLPRDMLIEIVSFLPVKSIGRVARVCKMFYKALEEPWLWRNMCMSHFPFCSVDRYGKDWKKCFIARSNIKIGWKEGKAGDFDVTSFRGHENYINCFQLYRSTLVTGSADHTIKIWKTSSEDAINTLTGHQGVINDLKFNETKIVSGASDSTVKIWDVRTGTLYRTLFCNGSVNSLQFDDSRIVTGSSDNNTRIWDIRSGVETSRLTGHSAPVTQVIYDQHRIYSLATDAIKVWDLRQSSFLLDFTDPSNQWSNSTCFTTAGSLIFAGSSSGKVHIFDVTTGQSSFFSGAQHNGMITDIKTDGKYVATAGQDSTVRVWSIATRYLAYTLSDHKQTVNSIQFHENKIVSGSADNSMRVWNLRDGKKMYALLGGSLQKRANNPDHPTKQGISQLQLDESRIVASVASLVKVYDFEKYKG